MTLHAADQTFAEQWGPWITAGGVTIAALIAFAVAIGNRRQTEKHWRITSRRERFTTIATQLADPNPAVRIAGVYAMEALTNDWLTKNHWYSWTWTKSRRTGHREAQACINVLCAYLRLPYTPPPGATTITKQIITTRRGSTKGAGTQTETHHEYRHDDSQVRNSITRTIAAHLQPNPPGQSWSKLDYDLSDAHIHNADFRSAIFASLAIFSGAQFHGEITRFDGARFYGEGTSFGGARFYGEDTTFVRTRFSSEITRFDGARFHGERTSFDGAWFYGDATMFVWAQFYGEKTSFDQAQFDGMQTSFGEAQFRSKETRFESVQFRSTHTLFDEAQFRSVITSFGEAQFHSRTTSFDEAQFHSETTFENPETWSNMHFDWDWPLPSQQEGPAPAKPQTVKPDEWPPNLAKRRLSIKQATQQTP